MLGPRRLCSLFLFCALTAAVPAPVQASQVSLISRADPGAASETAPRGAELRDASPRVSSDGRYVVFFSGSPNLVPGQVDPHPGWDVFLRDTVAGTTVLVSRAASSNATAANDNSDMPVISADGRYVAFYSSATDLVPGQTDGNGQADLFLFDRSTGAVSLVSHAAGAAATASSLGVDVHEGPPVLSADGGFVAYTSGSGNLVAGQSSNGRQVFLYDRSTGVNVLVSHAPGAPATGANASSLSPVLSADGRFVAYVSFSESLVTGSTLPGSSDIFLFDRTTGANRLVSHIPTSVLTGGNGESTSPRISADGRFVAFESTAADLAAGSGAYYSRPEVFLWDRDTDAITVIDRAPLLGLSGDGNWILFTSSEDDVIDGQGGTLSTFNVFLYERATGTVRLVSHLPGSATAGANGDSYRASISADGRWVTFMSEATDLVPGAESGSDVDEDVFLYDRVTGAVTLVSHAAGTPGTAAVDRSTVPEIAAGGGHILYQSLAWDLVAGLRDGNGQQDIFIHDRVAGTTTAVSRRAADRPSDSGGQRSGDGLSLSDPSYAPATSADGRWVVFTSDASDLVPGQVDSGASPDVFLHDRATGSTQLVSRKADSSPSVAVSGTSDTPSISADGRWVAFLSDSSSLVLGQTGSGSPNVFLFDRDTGAMTLVSHAPGSTTTAGNGDSAVPVLSADGSRVAFASRASNLVAGQADANNTYDVFVFERANGTVSLASHAAATPTTAGNDSSYTPRPSGDGRFIAFESRSTNLVAGQMDTNADVDVFLYDADSGSLTLVSHLPGSATATSHEPSFAPELSADGGFVVFTSNASNLVPGLIDANSRNLDAFLFARDTGTVTLVSRSSSSPTTTGNASSGGSSISADGAWIAFGSTASDIVEGQTEPGPYPHHTSPNVFLYERATGRRLLVSHLPGQPLAAGGGSPLIQAISGDGRFVLFSDWSRELVWGGAATASHADRRVFLYDREMGESILVSRSLASPTQPAARDSSFAYLSADGSTVAFSSLAPDLVPDDDFNLTWDLFAYDNGNIGSFYTLFPCRLIDTREPQDGPALASGGAVVLHLFNVCGIPETAKSLAVNVTVVQPTAAGHLTLYRGEMTTPPVASTLNFGAGQVRANNAILRLAASAEGTLRLLPFLAGGGTVHVLIDVVGYFE